MAVQYDYSDCPEYLKEFLFYMLTIKGRSKRTVDAYYIDLRTFLRYLKCVKVESKNPEDIEYFNSRCISDLSLDTLASLTLGDIYAYLSYTVEGRSNIAKTRSRKVSSIRSFFRYLTTKTGYLKRNPAEDLEVPTSKKTMPRYLTLEESLELLTHIDPNSRSYARDYCMVTFLLNCGMRLSELVGINLNDINLDEKKLRLLGKGNKERIIYLNDACLNALQAWLEKRETPQQVQHKNALFLSSRNTRITPRRVEQIIEDCLRNAGLSGQGYSPHKLRHTAATLMYQHGGIDIRVLKEILGHANVGTTEIYTHLSDRQMEHAAKNTPLANIMPQKAKTAPDLKKSGTEKD